MRQAGVRRLCRCAHSGVRPHAYPKHRARELAKASKVAVPAHAVEVADDEVLKTFAIVAVTPEETEVPVTTAIQTTPTEPVAVVARNEPAPVELPKTASTLPLFLLAGFASLALALGFSAYSKRSLTVSVR